MASLSFTLASPPSSVDTSDYSLFTSFSIQNDTSSDLLDSWLAFPINSSALTPSDVVTQADFDDVLVISNSGNVLETTLQDISLVRGNWWFRLDSLPAGSTRSFRIYTRSSTVTHDYEFGLNGVLDGATVTDDASLDITTNLTLDAENVVVFSIPSSSATADAGYILRKEGAYDLRVGDSQVIARIFGTATEILRPNAAGDFENIDGSSGACTGAGLHYTCVDEVVADTNTLVFEGGVISQDAYNLDNTSIPAGAVIGSIDVTGRSRCFNNGTGGGYQPGLRLSGTTQLGTLVEPLGGWTTRTETISRPGGGNWSVSDLDSLQIVQAIAAGGGSGTCSAGAQAEITQSFITVNYNTETEASGSITADTIFDAKATYDGATLVLLIDNATVATDTATFAISINANDLLLGDNEFDGIIDRLRIGDTSIASPTFKLDLTFEPSTITQTQEGSSGNSWTWLGTITDQSASTNDASYTLVRDLSDIAVIKGAVVPQTDTRGEALALVAGNIFGDLVLPTQGAIDSDFFMVPVVSAAAISIDIPSNALWWLIWIGMAFILQITIDRFIKIDFIGAGVVGVWIFLGIVNNLYDPAAGFLAIMALFTVKLLQRAILNRRV